MPRKWEILLLSRLNPTAEVFNSLSCSLPEEKGLPRVVLQHLPLGQASVSNGGGSIRACVCLKGKRDPRQNLREGFAELKWLLSSQPDAVR